MAIDWSRRTFLAVGAGLLPRPLFARRLAPPHTGSAKTEGAARRDRRRRQSRPVQADLGLARRLQRPGLVPGRQVRHLHPLGRLLRAGLRQRVVPAQHVSSRARQSSSITSRPTARRHSSATRISSRSSKPKSSIAAEWAELFKAAGAQVTSCLWPSITTASRCTTATSPTGCAAKMGPQRDVIGELADAVRDEGLIVRRLVPSRRALVVLRRRPQFDSDVQDPRIRRPLRPRAPISATAENQAEPPDQAFLDDWLAAHLRDRRQVPAAGRLVRLVDLSSRCSSRTCKRFAAYYYNRGAEWGTDVAINYKE